MTDQPRSDAYHGVWPTQVSTTTVYEPDRHGEPTGLLDQHGRPLVRPRPPIGFVDFDLLRRKSR